MGLHDQAAPLLPKPFPLVQRLGEFLLDAERVYLEAALREVGGKVIAAGALAGVSRRTIARMLRKHGLDKKSFRTA